MTVKKNITKAITITDFLITSHYKNAKSFEELVKDWNGESQSLGLTIASTHRDVAQCLELIKDLLLEKKIAKTPH